MKGFPKNMPLESVYQSLEYESIKPLKKYRKNLKKINAQKDYLRALSDSELKQELKNNLENWGGFNIHKQDQVNAIFAIAREVTYRLTGKFQYDVQVIGGLAALERNAIQMSTGSGKTLTLILPVVCFGLTHKGVYVLTVNDYLSKRDWEETSPIYKWFDLTTAYTDNNQPDPMQREAFEKDVIYCTNSTLGFAYLNSALASDIGRDIKLIHRPLYAAIIDECDEILMDDARNPLIIAGAGEKSSKVPMIEYNGKKVSEQEIVEKLKTLRQMEYDDDDNGKPFIDEQALKEIQKKLDVGSEMFKNEKLMHVIYSAVQAIFQNQNYTDYIVQDKPDHDTGSRIVLIDKATGRLAHGRTMSDGMHQFLEMKEGVYSGSDSQSTIQITYQILFNLFETIAGVSGTLGASYKEFQDIYGMGMVIVPDRWPSQLKQKTHLYLTQENLNEDLIRQVKLYVSSHHPVLIGARSDIAADMVSDRLTRAGIKHKLLVSTDKDEKGTIAKAGKPGSVVVTTDIMGRGTDIHVEDTKGERGLVVFQLNSRPNSRVERQFAGRAGRQGQPGRYERMLTIPETLDIGLEESKRKQLMAINRKNRDLIAFYHADLLLDGKNPDYTEIVRMIDQALVASESRYSQERVNDFKSYSIVDIIQTALIKQMDIIRGAIKTSLETKDKTELCNALADMSLSRQEKNESKRKQKRKIKKIANEYETFDLDILQNSAFNYVRDVVNILIPKMRQYSEEAIDTTRLAGQVQFNQTPESIMVELLNKFLDKHKDLVRFNINKLEKETG